MLLVAKKVGGRGRCYLLYVVNRAGKDWGGVRLDGGNPKCVSPLLLEGGAFARVELTKCTLLLELASRGWEGPCLRKDGRCWGWETVKD